MQDLNDKITGGNLSAAEWNQVPTEMQNIIEALGLVLTGADLNQMGKAIAGYAGASTFYAETGLADAYIVNPIGGKQGPPLLDANADGLQVRFLPGNANTGASTINVNALGAKSIVREDGGPLQAGDLLTTRDAFIRYDFGNDRFVLQNFSISAALDVPRGYIDGLILSNAADTANDITLAEGICRDESNVDTIQLSSALTKQIDVGGGWVAGNNQAGFPSLLTLTDDTWYHFFIIKNPGNGAVDCGFDSNVSATNLLADATGFTEWQRVGAIFYSVAQFAGIRQFRQHNDTFQWNASSGDVSITNPGTGEVVHTLEGVPLGLRVLADVSVTFGRPDTSSNTRYRTGPGGQTLPAASTSEYDARTQGDSRYGTTSTLILTDTVATMKTRQDGSNSNATLQIQTHGWVDPRGRDL